MINLTEVIQITGAHRMMQEVEVHQTMRDFEDQGMINRKMVNHCLWQTISSQVQKNS